MFPPSFSTIERVFRVASAIFILFFVSYFTTFLMHHHCALPMVPIIRRFNYIPPVVNPLVYSLTKTKFRRDAQFHVKMILKGKFGARQRARARTVSGI